MFLPLSLKLCQPFFRGFRILGSGGPEKDDRVLDFVFHEPVFGFKQLAIHADGSSFADLLQGESELGREAIYWHFPHYSNHGMQSPGGAIRSGDYKLLEYFENGTVQLFNLRDDLGEQHDLAREEPETAARLRAMLRQWRASVSANMMEPNLDYQPPQ